MMLASGWAANALAGQYNATLHAEEKDRGAQVQTTTDTGFVHAFYTNLQRTIGIWVMV